MLGGQEVVAVDPATAGKLELYSATRDQGITKHALAERLGLSDTSVGWLTDPDRRSRSDHVARALRAVGRALVIEGRASLARFALRGVAEAGPRRGQFPGLRIRDLKFRISKQNTLSRDAIPC